MFKLIVLVLGLAIGFGGGVWYAAKHPEWAQDFAAKEQQKFLETQLKIAKATKAKLDEMASRDPAKSPAGASSFVGGGAKKPDADIARLSQEQDAQIVDLEKQLADVKK
jgi:hypothetical protein